MQILTTRECAALIYLLLMFFYCISRKNIRNSISKVISSAFVPILILPVVIMLAYAISIAYIMNRILTWEWVYLKDILIWVIITGISECFNAIYAKTNDHYFRNMIFRNFKSTAFVSFFINTYTFSFVTELIIQPILFILQIFNALSKKEDKFKPIYQLTNYILGFIGFFVLFFTLKVAFNSINETNYSVVFIEFILPVVLSFLFMPIAYLLAVYDKYKKLFLRMDYNKLITKEDKKKNKKLVQNLCRLSLKRISCFLDFYTSKIIMFIDESTFIEFLNEFCIKYPN